MKIEVYETYNSVKEADIRDKLAVVIDVLRATSTIVTSLNNGCREVIPVSDIEEAVDISKNYDREECLLTGERNSLKIEGFDLSNSPAEFTRQVVKGKSVIITTTNGTNAIRQAGSAKDAVIGSLLNAQAVSDYIISKGEDVAFICAGTEGKFSLDDVLGAGAIIDRLDREGIELELDDLAVVAKFLYAKHRDNLEDIMQKARHFNSLKATKYYEDVDYCIKEDIISIVPEYKDGVLK
ncbi:MAG: 2-phosphosulfolactate phosphatase [Clostridiales bacterium]|nr:2-phosphosulfolactate phosphatase [Clostridiales bacterium]